jgi:hypothetical protein
MESWAKRKALAAVSGNDAHDDVDICTREHVDWLFVFEITLTFKSPAATPVATIILDRGILNCPRSKMIVDAHAIGAAGPLKTQPEMSLARLSATQRRLPKCLQQSSAG